MVRVLAVFAGVVNMICMLLAQITADQKVFLVAWFGAVMSFSGYLYFTEELRQRGQTRMGYQNLAMRLRWDIKEEGLRAGQRLPTTTQLARRHDTTRTTVMRALRILADEGLVEVVRGRGTYVVGENGFRGERIDKPKDRIQSHVLHRVQRAAPGEEMPTTAELMLMYGASHITVRRVLAGLAQQGVIRRTSNGVYVKP